MVEEEDAAAAASLQSFLEWAAAELGISDSRSGDCQPGKFSCLGRSLFVSHFPHAGGRGLAAARDLRRGELILRVPKGALMTSEALMKEDHKLSAVLTRHPFLSSAQFFIVMVKGLMLVNGFILLILLVQILAIALLNEVNKGNSSWWYPYLKQIPRSYDMLAGFGQFEIQALQVDDAIWAAEKAAGKVKSEWEEVSVVMCELKLKPALQNFKAWLWASATISSRTLHIPWNDAGCLCPVGDFFNYAAPTEEQCDCSTLETSGNGLSMQIERAFDANAQRLLDAGFEEDVGAYCFYARRNYREGEQAFLSYGMYTNLELLEHYGFLLNDNPNDKGFIPLEPDMYSLCSWPIELLYIDQDGKPSFALLSTMRLWATPPNKRRSVGHFAYSGNQLSSENEMIVMAWMAKKCQDILCNLMTSVEEDKSLLDIIGKIQDNNLPHEDLEKLPPTCKSELRAFLQSHDVTNAEDITNLGKSRKARQSISTWKLAVEWRLSYKKKLKGCITG